MLVTILDLGVDVNVTGPFFTCAVAVIYFVFTIYADVLEFPLCLCMR